MSRGMFLVARHEFLETVKTKSFLISLIVIPASMLLGMSVMSWLRDQTAVTRNVAVVDRSGEDIAADIARTLERIHARAAMAEINRHVRAHARPEYRTPRGLDPAQVPIVLLKGRDDFSEAEIDAFIDRGGLALAMTIAMPFLKPDAPPPLLPAPPARIVDLPGELAAELDDGDVATALRPWLNGARRLDGDGRLHAAIVIPEGVRPADGDSLAALGRGDIAESVLILSEGALPDALGNLLPDALDEVFRRRALERDFDAGTVARLLAATRTAAPVLELDISAGAGREVTPADVIERVLPRLLSVLLVYFLYINMFMLMSNTMEEKSNRIIEVLVSSVTPNELMVGKLLGSSAVALTMFVFSVGALIGIFMIGGSSALVEVTTILLGLVLSSSILPWLLLNFILGYFLFAGIFLTLGAIAESSKDIQNLSVPPIIFMMMVPVIVWAFAEDPNGTGARILSFLPFFGPFMMMARVNADPTIFEIVGSMAVQILTISFLLWGSGKLFRAAILFSGRPKFGALLRIARSET